jgi:hypothetical protein
LTALVVVSVLHWDGGSYICVQYTTPHSAAYTRHCLVRWRDSFPCPRDPTRVCSCSHLSPIWRSVQLHPRCPASRMGMRQHPSLYASLIVPEWFGRTSLHFVFAGFPPCGRQRCSSPCYRPFFFFVVSELGTPKCRFQAFEHLGPSLLPTPHVILRSSSHKQGTHRTVGCV